MPPDAREVQAQIRESLGLAPKPKSTPTVPTEGHVADFPFWSFSKRRSGVSSAGSRTAGRANTLGLDIGSAFLAEQRPAGEG
jgi:hypothetical protein